VDSATIREEVSRALRRCHTVLDVGCGDGSLVRFLAENIAEEALGIDIAAERLDTGPHGSGCVKQDAHRMASLDDDSFDAVVCVRAFHEFSRPQKALHEIRRVLKSGGLLFIADFAKGHEGERIWGERYYSPEEMFTILKANGFESLSVKTAKDEAFLFIQARNTKHPESHPRT